MRNIIQRRIFRNRTVILFAMILTMVFGFPIGTWGESLNASLGNIVISTAGDYIISGTSTINNIAVTDNVIGAVNITLQDVSIDASNVNEKGAFSIGSGTMVNLTLVGDSTFKSGNYRAGLAVPDGATLNITAQSTGSLNAIGGRYAAGIGGNGGSGVSKSGTLNIYGGTISATGGNYAAGIGGGYCYDGGVVNVIGGKVTATSGIWGAGIGGGGAESVNEGNGGTVSISGGTVMATSISMGAGIGGGGSVNVKGGNGGAVSISSGVVTAVGDGGAGIGIGGGKGTTTGSGGTISITGGSVNSSTNVIAKGSAGIDIYKTTISGMPVVSPITCMANGSTFNTVTDSAGKLYLWLPVAANTHVSAIENGTLYHGVGAVTNSGMSTFSVAPINNTVVASSIAPISGVDNLITFTVIDGFGNADTSFDGEKNVTITGIEAASNGSYGNFNGTTLSSDSSGVGQVISVVFTDGVATANLKLNKADAQTIRFSIESATTTKVNSLTITPTSGIAAMMAVTQDITAPSANGGMFAQQPKITLKDYFGNICSGDSSTVVTASKEDGGSWILTGTTSSTAVNGVVTFTNLRVSNTTLINGAQLRFTATGLTNANSGMVTLPAAPVLISITWPGDVSGLASGTAKTAAALGLPTTVALNTTTGSYTATVVWNVAGSSYDPASKAAQTFTVSGTATIPGAVVNENNVSLTKTVSVSVLEGPPVLNSITWPGAISGLANGTAKTPAALGLPTTVSLNTTTGSYTATVVWNVAGSSYDPASKAAQTFTVSGTATLPGAVMNENNVSLTNTVSISVLEGPPVLNSITWPSDVSGLASGTAKTAAALGLPTTVALNTTTGSYTATVIWNVAGSSYNPTSKAAQTFTVGGTATIPGAVVNENNVSLTKTVSVSVLEGPPVLNSITWPGAIFGLANGTAKTPAALGLPTTVSLNTTTGSYTATVVWNVDGSSYNPTSKSAQTFTVSGIATIPGAVVNENNVSLTNTVSVSVLAGNTSSGGSGGGSSSVQPVQPPTQVVLQPVVTPVLPVVTPAPVVKTNETVQLTLSKVKIALEQAILSKHKTLVLPIELPKGAQAVKIELDLDLAKAINKGGIKELVFRVGQESYIFDQKMIGSMNQLKTKKITFAVERLAGKVGKMPKTTFKLESNITGGTLVMTVPYTLSKGEQTSDLQVFTLKGKGKEVRVKGVKYNEKTKHITLSVMM